MRAPASGYYYSSGLEAIARRAAGERLARRHGPWIFVAGDVTWSEAVEAARARLLETDLTRLRIELRVPPLEARASRARIVALAVVFLVVVAGAALAAQYA